MSLALVQSYTEETEKQQNIFIQMKVEMLKIHNYRETNVKNFLINSS